MGQEYISNLSLLALVVVGGLTHHIMFIFSECFVHDLFSLLPQTFLFLYFLFCPTSMMFFSTLCDGQFYDVRQSEGSPERVYEYVYHGGRLCLLLCLCGAVFLFISAFRFSQACFNICLSERKKKNSKKNLLVFFISTPVPLPPPLVYLLFIVLCHSLFESKDPEFFCEAWMRM